MRLHFFLVSSGKTKRTDRAIEMAKKIKNSTRISGELTEGASDTLIDLFGTKHGGVIYVLEAFPLLYNNITNQLKGILSRNELKFIISVFAGYRLKPDLAGQQLEMQIRKSIEKDGAQRTRKPRDPHMSVDKNELIKRIRGICYQSRVFLEIWASGFWKKKGRDIEGWIDKIDQEPRYCRKATPGST